jgi:superfamily I DNA/RNA helicase
MTERLAQLLPERGHRVEVMTFHALGLRLLRRHADAVGLAPTFRVADDHQRRQLLIELCDLSDRRARRQLADISRAKRTPVPIDADSDIAVTREQYDQLLRERGLVDFDDLIVLSSRLLEADATLAAAYRTRWLWISVDEFQDIDPAQYDLLRQLVPGQGNVCVIGDPDQSIYGFRGADAGLFRRFAADYPSAREVHLTRNYRSSRTIVDAALQVIAPSSLLEDRQLEACSRDADRIQIRACPTQRAEAEMVVHTIERLIGGTTLFSMDSGRVETHEGQTLSFSDFAVLYRTEAQADVLDEAFERSGIPRQRKSHGVLGDEPAVQAMVRFCQEPSESAEGPTSQPVAVELLKRAADSVWSDFPEAATYLAALMPLAEQCGDDVPRLLSELAMGVDADLWDPRADRVSLLTLHAAKGLEFPVVFLVGCEDGLLPLRWGTACENVDEERRLFFVGMTRARDRLFLSHAAKRRWRGKVQPMEVSPFLREIKEELLERAERAERRRRKQKQTSQLELF